MQCCVLCVVVLCRVVCDVVCVCVCLLLCACGVQADNVCHGLFFFLKKKTCAHSKLQQQVWNIAVVEGLRLYSHTLCVEPFSSRNLWFVLSLFLAKSRHVFQISSQQMGGACEFAVSSV